MTFISMPTKTPFVWKMNDEMKRYYCFIKGGRIKNGIRTEKAMQRI